jgi:plasmid replication initiation protein
VGILDLVKYHNDINTLKLGSFGEKELDVFFSIIFKLRDKGTEPITLKYGELHKLADTSGHNNRMYNYITGLDEKLLGLNQKMILPDGATRNFNLFEYIDTKDDWDYIRVRVTETFSYMLNDLIGNYTRFDLKTLVNLKSGYSKQLFKILKQYEGQGPCSWYWVELEEFKELLGVSKNYSTTNFNKKVLAPLEKELGEIFDNFKINKLTKEGEPVGRGKKTHSIKFTWEKKVPLKTLKEVNPIKYKGTTPEAITEPIKAPDKQEVKEHKEEVLQLAAGQLPKDKFNIFKTTVKMLRTKEQINNLVVEFSINKTLGA